MSEKNRAIELLEAILARLESIDQRMGMLAFVKPKGARARPSPDDGAPTPEHSRRDMLMGMLESHDEKTHAYASRTLEAEFGVKL